MARYLTLLKNWMRTTWRNVLGKPESHTETTTKSESGLGDGVYRSQILSELQEQRKTLEREKEIADKAMEMLFK